MTDAPDLRLLFATDFSQRCYRAAAAIGQLADTCRLKLTIVHAVGPDDEDLVWQRRRELDAFLECVDRDVDCRPLLLRGHDPAADIADLCAAKRFDLVMAPGSSRRPWHGLLSPSFRSRLMRQCG